MKQTLFLLLALAVTLGLLAHAPQERTRLMTPEPPEEEPLFQKVAQNTTRLWEPPQPPLNISQVTVEHRRLP